MMHFKPESRHTSGGTDAVLEAAGYREALAEVEKWGLRVREAKRVADASLLRVTGAPGPHVTANAAFARLYETHQRDREALFEAMRRLDEAREALRAIHARPGGTGRSERDMPDRHRAVWG